MSFLKQALTWWNGQTTGTRFYTWRFGSRVGEDEFGNVYYQSGRRRWVIYAGEADASSVPPEWHGWLHQSWLEPPTEKPVPHKPWEKEHLPNLTGTTRAYAPSGSIRREVPTPRSNYEAWSPE